MKFTSVLLTTLGLMFGVAHAQLTETPVSPAIEHGSAVQLEYTLKDLAGTTLHFNVKVLRVESPKK